jgi:hypothetical protein
MTKVTHFPFYPGIDAQEFNTILAALRWYQVCGMDNPSNRPGWLHDIATNGGEEVSMDDEGIDALCERLNTGG